VRKLNKTVNIYVHVNHTLFKKVLSMFNSSYTTAGHEHYKPNVMAIHLTRKFVEYSMVIIKMASFHV